MSSRQWMLLPSWADLHKLCKCPLHVGLYPLVTHTCVHKLHTFIHSRALMHGTVRAHALACTYTHARTHAHTHTHSHIHTRTHTRCVRECMRACMHALLVRACVRACFRAYMCRVNCHLPYGKICYGSRVPL